MRRAGLSNRECTGFYLKRIHIYPEEGAVSLNIEYVNSENKKERPVMIHRALLGSVERFTAVLLEHYAGNLPGWLSPTQIDILTIGNVEEYKDKLLKDLKDLTLLKDMLICLALSIA